MFRRHPLRWPLLISGLSATFGVAVALVVGIRTYYAGFRSWDVLEVWLPAMGGAFIILSIYTFLGRAWARRALVALFLVIAAVMVFVGVFQASFGDAPLFIVSIGVVLFIVAVLCHRDVVAAFTRERGG
jgi:hypothetical protein